MATRNPVSVETILTFDNRDAQSQWSEVWSTTHIPGMDNASGGDGLSGIQGRKKLRFGALILGSFLTMHCRVTASALTGGVCLGIAICINALVRAIICCAMAAICAIYVVYSVSDSKLPFSYCSVEVVLFREDYNFGHFNITLMIALVVVWICLWLLMIWERIAHKRGGVALLESVDALMTGISTPFVCILELVAILYVYRGRDFVSDMNIATEENACSSRIDTQWQIIPVITLVTLIIKLSVVFVAELPKMSLAYAAAALVAVVIAGPLRAVRNAVVFMRARRHK
ncbi:unnamed protein product [Danaus chrysippus]|uniref:(African queen) hypothetical protein n=1 Tax=Danaus chrysippus TaxID=151541 RepID=A0A8J2QZZ6_9NEOP|nr:unnamed protein product [Danaus chrysippus]